LAIAISLRAARIIILRFLNWRKRRWLVAAGPKPRALLSYRGFKSEVLAVSPSAVCGRRG
jgi:hypothetical protein